MPTAQKSVVRLVLDTNTAISGLLWHGTPGKLIDAAHSKSVTLCTSAILLAELRGVLTREKFTQQLATRRLNAIEDPRGRPQLVFNQPLHRQPSRQQFVV